MMPDEEKKTIPRKPETLERMERIREELRKKPTATIRELATGTGLTINIVQNIVRRYSAEVGWTNNIDERYRHRTEEEHRQRVEAIGGLARQYPEMLAKEIARCVKVNREVVGKILKEHPEWGWVGRRKVKTEERDDPPRQVRRRTPPGAAEKEMFKIQRAAEAEGFGANNYGAFMAAIGYNWEGYQRGGMQRCSVRMRQEEG